MKIRLMRFLPTSNAMCLLLRSFVLTFKLYLVGFIFIACLRDRRNYIAVCNIHLDRVDGIVTNELAEAFASRLNVRFEIQYLTQLGLIN